MKKKSKNLLSWGLKILAAACGVAAFFVIFADAVNYSALIFGDSFTGLQVALGYTVNDIAVFKASAGIILAYLFPLVGACLLIIGESFKPAVVLAAAMMVTGGVLALCALSLLNGTYVGEPSLAAGAISSGILSIVGGLAACGSILIKA